MFTRNEIIFVTVLLLITITITAFITSYYKEYKELTKMIRYEPVFCIIYVDNATMHTEAIHTEKEKKEEGFVRESIDLSHLDPTLKD
jgi:hypothetical protein